MFRKFEKITRQWIALFTFRTTAPWVTTIPLSHSSALFLHRPFITETIFLLLPEGPCKRLTNLYNHPLTSCNFKANHVTGENGKFTQNIFLAIRKFRSPITSAVQYFAIQWFLSLCPTKHLVDRALECVFADILELYGAFWKMFHRNCNLFTLV